MKEDRVVQSYFLYTIHFFLYFKLQTLPLGHVNCFQFFWGHQVFGIMKFSIN